MSKLALLGGSQIITNQNEELFLWPIVTPEMEEAVLEVLRKRKISSMDITVEFEKEYAEWLGVKYALAHNNGTSAIHSSGYEKNDGFLLVDFLVHSELPVSIERYP